MSRDAGFAVADVSTSMLDDPKFRALWRTLGDPAAMSRGVLLYVATLLESWRAGERAAATAAAPMWLDGVPELEAALRAAGLIDDEGMIPAHAWQSWFVPAVERRDATRERWRRSNKRRQITAQRGSSAVTATSRRSHDGDPVRTVPTDPSDRSVRLTVPPVDGGVEVDVV